MTLESTITCLNDVLANIAIVAAGLVTAYLWASPDRPPRREVWRAARKDQFVAHLHEGCQVWASGGRHRLPARPAGRGRPAGSRPGASVHQGMEDGHAVRGAAWRVIETGTSGAGRSPARTAQRLLGTRAEAQGQHHTNALKEVIVLKQALACRAGISPISADRLPRRVRAKSRRWRKQTSGHTSMKVEANPCGSRYILIPKHHQRPHPVVRERLTIKPC
jgi:hypothetical protein